MERVSKPKGSACFPRLLCLLQAIVAKPLYELLQKNVEFVWTQECDDAMEILKEALTNAPALGTLDYADDAGEIILAVDASGEGCGAIL